jgi:hypothetical protein
LAEAAQIDGHHFKPSRPEGWNLGRPTLFGKASAVDEQNCTISAAVHKSGNRSAILGREGDGALRMPWLGKRESGDH